MNENNFQSETYKKGVLDFLMFLHENVSGDKHSCPCRRCRNGKGLIVVGDIFVHLMKFGIDKNYTFWSFHGETPLVNDVQPPGDIADNIDDSNMLRLNDLVNDACEVFMRESCPSNPNCEKDNGDISTNASDAPQSHKGTKYERLSRLAMEPLHQASGESRHSTMYALVKINDLKTQFNMSDGATEEVLSLLKELLPEGNNLPSSYHEMKNTIRDIGMDYVKYDVCINNCMLFWKEHERLEKCVICGAGRYKYIA
jgi:hypothetical protein